VYQHGICLSYTLDAELGISSMMLHCKL